MEIIKSYKGFNRDMTCRDFQYEEGKEYETEKAHACESGFHACEYPLDCFGYYEPSKSVFHVVEQSGEISKEGSDSKVASTKIKIGAEIGIPGLVKAAIEYTTSKAEKKNVKHNEERYGASSNTGYRGASSNTGDYGASSNTGNCGASSNTGYRGTSETGHPNSIALAWGPESKAKGVKGSFLVLAEWKSNGGCHWEEKTWEFVGAVMVQVDGETIKENVLYTLKNGKVVEAE